MLIGTKVMEASFSTLLQGDDDINASTSEDREPAQIVDDGVEIQPAC